VASAALGFIGAVSVVILVGIEHSRILRPSSLVLLYLLATVVADAVQVRTLFLRGYATTLAGLSCGSLASRAFLLVLESCSKKSYLKPVEDGYSPEELASVFSRSVFWWLNPILLLGNRKILALEDLYPLNHVLESSSLKARIVRSWEKRMYHQEQRVEADQRQMDPAVLTASSLPTFPASSGRRCAQFLLDWESLALLMPKRF
jgi:ATP-binding cassette, subfamily C (CFTR/MRP), member 1